MNPETIYALIADAVYSRSGPNAANNDLNVATVIPLAVRANQPVGWVERSDTHHFGGRS